MKPKERIKTAAAELFRERGYHGTGISDILKESGAHKASFYKYYTGKTELALEYLESERLRTLEVWRNLTENAASYTEFVETWVERVRGAYEINAYQGCAFSNFAGLTEPIKPGENPGTQTIQVIPEFQDKIHSVMDEWVEIFTDYLLKKAFPERDMSISQARAMSRRMVLFYEGMVHLYRMTGREDYLEDFRESLLMLGRPT